MYGRLYGQHNKSFPGEGPCFCCSKHGMSVKGVLDVSVERLACAQISNIMFGISDTNYGCIPLKA